MLKNLKENWLIAVISGATGCVITLFLIFICHVKTWDSNAWSTFFNFFVAVSTIALAVFAWMAYRYAIDSYIEQQNAKTLWEKKYNLIVDAVNGTLSFVMSANGIFDGNKRFFNEHPKIPKGMESRISMNFMFYYTDTKAFKGEIDELRDIIMEKTKRFPELNLLGVSEGDLKNIGALFQQLLAGLNQYQQQTDEYLKILQSIHDAVKNDQSIGYESNIKILNGINTDAFKIPQIEESYSGLMKIGRELLNIPS